MGIGEKLHKAKRAVGDKMGDAGFAIKKFFIKTEQGKCQDCGKEIFEEDNGLCAKCRTKHHLSGNNALNISSGVGAGILGTIGYILLNSQNQNDSGSGEV